MGDLLLERKAPLDVFFLSQLIKELQLEETEIDEMIEAGEDINRFLEVSTEDIIDVTKDPDYGTQFFKFENLIGLKIFRSVEIYNICEAYLAEQPDNISKLSDLINYVSTHNEDENLHISLLDEKLIKEEILKLSVQFPKIFILNKLSRSIKYKYKSDLKTEVVKLIVETGDMVIDSKGLKTFKLRKNNDEIVDALNSSDKYFNALQAPVTSADIRKLTRSNDSALSDYLFSKIELDLLAPVEDKFKYNNTQNIFSFLAKYFNNTTDVNINLILAVHFIGDSFPLPEARGYLKIRPVIRFEKISISKMTLPLQGSIFGVLLSQMTDYLKAFMPKNVDVEEWCVENLSITWFEDKETIIPIDTIYQYLIEKHSPILNIDDNPGNLLYYTINEKIQTYISTKENLLSHE